jgi:hypothetical protein
VYLWESSGFIGHVTNCIDDTKNFIPTLSIAEDIINEVMHVKLFAEKRMEFCNKDGFKVDDEWEQGFKLF